METKKEKNRMWKRGNWSFLSEEERGCHPKAEAVTRCQDSTGISGSQG